MKKQEFQTVRKKHSIAATLLYTPVKGGTAYAAKRTTSCKA